MREMVVDASVVLKWYLPDESWGQRALRLLELHVTGELTLLAPTILPYEVLNALLVAERRGRADKQLTEESFEAFWGLELTLVDPFALDILPMAREFSRSIYDAAYIALAGARKIDLLTDDQRLYHAAGHQLQWLQWIGDDALAEFLGA